MSKLCFLIISSLILCGISPTIFAENVPAWVKNTAGWWANNQISDNDFVNSIQYLIRVGIIIIPQTENILTDSPAIKPSVSILDTTSFFEVVVDHFHMSPSKHPELYTINSEGLGVKNLVKINQITPIE